MGNYIAFNIMKNDVRVTMSEGWVGESAAQTFESRWFRTHCIELSHDYQVVGYIAYERKLRLRGLFLPSLRPIGLSIGINESTPIIRASSHGPSDDWITRIHLETRDGHWEVNLVEKK